MASFKQEPASSHWVTLLSALMSTEIQFSEILLSRNLSFTLNQWFYSNGYNRNSVKIMVFFVFLAIERYI